MKTYVVTLDYSKGLLDDYEIIPGTSPKDAMRRKFPDKKVERLYGDDANHANYGICEGYEKNGRIILKARVHTCYFKVLPGEATA